MKIEINKKLQIKHAVYIREKVKSQDINTEINEVINFLKTNQLNKTGAIASATLGIEQKASGNLIELEIICPVDANFKTQGKYQYIHDFTIENSLYIRYEGLPNQLPNVYEELLNYIKQNELTPATPVYTLTIKEPTLDSAGCIIDIYIGVK